MYGNYLNSATVYACCLLSAFFASAQQTGPVFENFGQTYSIENPDIPASNNMLLKAVFDVYSSPESREHRNPQLETAARYLNMHVRNGMALDNLGVALVIHGKAADDLLKSAAYKEKHGVENPNGLLVRQLLDAGVHIAICGQSASYQGISRDQMIPGVQWSLSAMSALVYFQNEGYRFIKF